MNTRLHAKILKNLYNLRHERYLQKCHAIINICFAVWLAFLGIIATYLIEGDGEFNDIVLEFILIGTSVIFSLSYFFYRISKSMRYDTLRKMKELNNYANEL